MKWKLIAVDNFDRENVDDYLIADNFTNEQFAQECCDMLNAKYSGDSSPFYCRVVNQDHKLYTFEP